MINNSDRIKHKYSLPREFKEAWIKALKSGNYVQGSGSLRKEMDNTDNPSLSQHRSTPTYCCLGVACSVAGVPEEYITGEWIDYVDGYEYDVVPEILHGVSDENQLVEALSCMNDTHTADTTEHKFSFEDIADWIDDNIKGTE
jgi:hypothetical protein